MQYSWEGLSVTVGPTGELGWAPPLSLSALWYFMNGFTFSVGCGDYMLELHYAGFTTFLILGRISFCINHKYLYKEKEKGTSWVVIDKQLQVKKRTTEEGILD